MLPFKSGELGFINHLNFPRMPISMCTTATSIPLITSVQIANMPSTKWWPTYTHMQGKCLLCRCNRCWYLMITVLRQLEHPGCRLQSLSSTRSKIDCRGLIGFNTLINTWPIVSSTHSCYCTITLTVLYIVNNRSYGLLLPLFYFPIQLMQFGIAEGLNSVLL